MNRTDRATLVLAALLRARTPGSPGHLVRKAIELAELLAAELERREPFDFEPLTVPPWEWARLSSAQ